MDKEEKRLEGKNIADGGKLWDTKRRVRSSRKKRVHIRKEKLHFSRTTLSLRIKCRFLYANAKNKKKIQTIIRKPTKTKIRLPLPTVDLTDRKRKANAKDDVSPVADCCWLLIPTHSHSHTPTDTCKQTHMEIYEYV